MSTPTSAIRKRTDMSHAPLKNCHEGTGILDWTEVTQGSDSPSGALRFIHDDILPPGVSIGVHPHTGDEEYYYIVSGSGVMTLDGAEYAVEAGDISAVYPGGSHGLENRSNADLRVIVISVRRGDMNQPDPA